MLSGLTSSPSDSAEPASGGRIRLALIIHSLESGGAERQFLQLVTGLDRTKFEPIIFVGRPSQERPESNENCVILGPAPYSRATAPLQFAVRILNLAKHLRHFRPHILHSFLEERTLWMSAAADAISPVPVFIGNRRSSVNSYRHNALQATLERASMRRLDAMLTISHALEREVIADGFPRVETIPIGVDINHFHPGGGEELRAQLGWNNGEKIIGMVANFWLCKGHADFVKAAAILHAHHPECRFLLMGNERGTLAGVRRQIAEIGLAGVFHIVEGSLDAAPIYQAMNIYLCTSESEGFGNAVLEAMASGVPVVATRVGGLVEALTDGVEGLLIPVHSAEAAAEAVERVLHDELLALHRAAAARQRVLARHSVAGMVRAHEVFYEEFLREGRKRREYDTA
jgi:glycosyltransferase involved in cell wall biosynthesis